MTGSPGIRIAEHGGIGAGFNGGASAQDGHQISIALLAHFVWRGVNSSQVYGMLIVYFVGDAGGNVLFYNHRHQACQKHAVFFDR